MMDMNQTFAYAPIPCCKGKATDIAGGSVMSNTSLTGDWVALIGVDLYLLSLKYAMVGRIKIIRELMKGCLILLNREGFNRFIHITLPESHLTPGFRRRQWPKRGTRVGYWRSLASLR
jgi:hypothetical protein